MALFISTTLFAWTHTFTSIVASSSRSHPFHNVALLSTQPCFVSSHFLLHFLQPDSVIHCSWEAYLDVNLSAMIHCIDNPIVSTFSNNLVLFRPHGPLSESFSW